MVGISWCLKQKNGIELVEPSEEMSESYLKMAEEAVEEIKNVKSQRWISSTTYYSLYYCLYSIMMKLGVKCEIHQCSIEFMKCFLTDFFNLEEIDLIGKGFKYRKNLQYYPDKLIDNKKLEFVKLEVSNFLVKTKEVLLEISEEKVDEIRSKIKEVLNE